MFAYKRQAAPDEAIIATLQELAERFPDRGLANISSSSGVVGHSWNHKQVYRVYCALGLNRRRIGKKRLPPRQLTPLCQRK